MTNEEILRNKIKERFGDNPKVNQYAYEQCIIAGVLEAMEEAKNLRQSDVSGLLPLEQYPDNEAKGIVFCGKCGKQK